MNRRVLFLDDEIRLLDGVRRSLRDAFEIVTQTEPLAALELLGNEPPFAVIVSDMRMPVMDGATFLTKVRAKHPDTTRILLTGQTDIKSAIDAVNGGQIFRFLCKPCPSDVLSASIESGIAQYRLVTSEKDLLEKTLAGAVHMMAEVLALSSPLLFEQAGLIKRYTSHICDVLEIADRASIEMAASLCKVGMIALPEDLVAIVNSGSALTPDQRRTYEDHVATAYRLLSPIPRLEGVASIIRALFVPASALLELDEKVVLGVRILRAAMEVERRVARGASVTAAAQEAAPLVSEDLKVFVLALRSYRGGGGATIVKHVKACELTPHMVLDEDVLNREGLLVVPAGRELNHVIIEKLRRLSAARTLREPMRARVLVGNRLATAEP